MQTNKHLSRLPVFGIIAFLLLGLALVLWPGAVLRVLPLAVGAVLVLVGAQIIAHTLALRRRIMQPALQLLRGAVNILAGLLTITHRDISISFFTVLFGLYVLLIAVLDISAALSGRADGRPLAVPLANAAAKLVLGVLMLFAPLFGQKLWARALGLYFVAAAATALVSWLREQKHKDKPQDGSPPSPD